MSKATNTSNASCPCGSIFPGVACCVPFVAGLGIAPTAEALMRSRYTAFAMSNSVYLLDTWHSSTRPPALLFEREQRWLGLKIVNTTDGLAGDDSGMVQFVARYKIADKKNKSLFLL